MLAISGRALSIFKDACGVHEFTEIEQARMEVLAEQVEEILKASKERARKAVQDR